jgi:hypothetical protein
LQQLFIYGEQKNKFTDFTQKEHYGSAVKVKRAEFTNRSDRKSIEILRDWGGK